MIIKEMNPSILSTPPRPTNPVSPKAPKKVRGSSPIPPQLFAPRILSFPS